VDVLFVYYLDDQRIYPSILIIGCILNYILVQFLVSMTHTCSTWVFFFFFCEIELVHSVFSHNFLNESIFMSEVIQFDSYKIRAFWTTRSDLIYVTMVMVSFMGSPSLDDVFLPLISCKI
jgi:hypothetical protein